MIINTWFRYDKYTAMWKHQRSGYRHILNKAIISRKDMSIVKSACCIRGIEC